jgi:hypothetical protein
MAPATAGASVTSFRSRSDLVTSTVTVLTPARRTAPGWIFVAPQTGPGQCGPMIIDDSGDLVWFRPLASLVAMNFRVQHLRGSPVLTWWEGTVDGGYGSGTGVIADNGYRDLYRVRAGNGYEADLHEFQLTARGTALLTIVQPVPGDLRDVGGPAAGTFLESILQEIDVVSGRVLFEWRASEHVALVESYAPLADPFDFFHANSIDVDSDGNLLVSARHTWAVYKLDRTTGAVIGRIGGKRSDYTLEPGAQFYWQHDARRQADGTITIFDDGSDGDPGYEPWLQQNESVSRAIRLRLDNRTKTATLVRDYAQPEGLVASAEGSAQLLADGGVFVGWGNIPCFSEFDAGGTLRLDARLADGSPSYRAYRYEWQAAPGEPPALAVEPSARAGGVAYASWNGATDTAAWRLLGGANRGSLRPLRKVERSGFETAIPFAQDVAWVAVEALAGSGDSLGRSAARPV